MRHHRPRWRESSGHGVGLRRDLRLSHHQRPSIRPLGNTAAIRAGTATRNDRRAIGAGDGLRGESDEPHGRPFFGDFARSFARVNPIDQRERRDESSRRWLLFHLVVAVPESRNAVRSPVAVSVRAAGGGLAGFGAGHAGRRRRQRFEACHRDLLSAIVADPIVAGVDEAEDVVDHLDLSCAAVVERGEETG